MSTVTESVRKTLPDGLPEDPLETAFRAVARHKWISRFVVLELALFGAAVLAALTLGETAGSMLAAMLASLGLLGLTAAVLYTTYAAIRRLLGPGGLVDAAGPSRIE